nr:MAG TPA: Portal [Caudoviricetes sp.]
MTFWEWFGFENSRDSPQPETPPPKEGLPQVTDNVRDSGQTFVFGRSNAGEQVDEKAAMQIPTVYACVRLLAESIAALPLHLYRVTDENGNKEKARDHPLYKILYRQPNPEMTSFVFWETLMTHLLLWGNAYAQIVRDGKNTVLGLYPLLPENVEVDRDESGELYYIYHAYTDEVPGEQNKDIYFRRDEIFHVPGLGFNGLIGFSPIAMMKNSLGTSIAVDRYGSSFFKNGAQPSGVLEHPGVIKDPNRVRDNWEAAYGGAANAHRVAVLEEGMTYKPISLPPEDSQFLETKQFSVTEICRIFRVPPHLVADLSRATFSNIEYQSLNFVMHSLTPWIVRIKQGIIKDLLLEEEQDT